MRCTTTKVPSHYNTLAGNTLGKTGHLTRTSSAHAAQRPGLDVLHVSQSHRTAPFRKQAQAACEQKRRRRGIVQGHRIIPCHTQWATPCDLQPCSVRLLLLLTILMMRDRVFFYEILYLHNPHRVYR